MVAHNHRHAPRVLRIPAFELRACFGFRDSSFGFCHRALRPSHLNAEFAERAEDAAGSKPGGRKINGREMRPAGSLPVFAARSTIEASPGRKHLQTAPAGIFLPNVFLSHLCQRPAISWPPDCPKGAQRPPIRLSEKWGQKYHTSRLEHLFDPIFLTGPVPCEGQNDVSKRRPMDLSQNHGYKVMPGFRMILSL